MRPLPKPSGRPYTKRELELVAEIKRFTGLKGTKKRALKDAQSQLRQLKKMHDKKDPFKTSQSYYVANSRNSPRKSGIQTMRTRPVSKEELAKMARVETLDLEYHAARMAAEQRIDMLRESVSGKRRA